MSPTRRYSLRFHKYVFHLGEKAHLWIAIGKLKYIAVSQPGEIFLLCSDGLTDMLEDDRIQELLSLAINLNEKVIRLVEAAVEAGGYDNVTVALCEVI